MRRTAPNVAHVVVVQTGRQDDAAAFTKVSAELSKVLGGNK
jgi:beta-lactamase class A